jgi:uncharacterized protein (DUF1800 family)
MKPAYYIYLAVLLALGGLTWTVRHEHSGKLEAQQALHDYKTQQAQAVADAVAVNEAKHKQAEANNDAILNDLQGKLDAAAASSNDLAHRLSNALAASHHCPVSSGGNQPPVATAPGEPNPADAAQRLTAAVGSYIEACDRDAARFSALQAELAPQL